MTVEDMDEFAKLNKKNILGWNTVYDKDKNISSVTYTMANLIDCIFELKNGEIISYTKHNNDVQYDFPDLCY